MTSVRQNTAVLGIACFIETPSVALKESEQNKTGGKKDTKEIVQP